MQQHTHKRNRSKRTTTQNRAKQTKRNRYITQQTQTKQINNNNIETQETKNPAKFFNTIPLNNLDHQLKTQEQL